MTGKCYIYIYVCGRVNFGGKKGEKIITPCRFNCVNYF